MKGNLESILIINFEGQLFWPTGREFLDKNFNVTEARSLEDVAGQIINASPHLIVLIGNSFSEGMEKFFQWKKTAYSSLHCILISESLDKKGLNQFINVGGVYGFFSPESHVQELENFINSISVLSYDLAKQNQLIGEFKLQNLQLEKMTRDLEGLVRGRTQDIQKSKNEVEIRVRKMRRLISFVESLSSIRKLEDLILVIREILQSEYGRVEPILACESLEKDPWLFYLRKNQVLKKMAPSTWEKGVRIRENNIDDQSYLANVFARPFHKVVAFPLQTKSERSRSVVLFLEHMIGDHQLDEFVQFVGERLQSLSLALDRSLLELDLERSTFLWESTFNSIDEPIAVFENDNLVIRSNASFENTFSDWEAQSAKIQVISDSVNGEYPGESIDHKASTIKFGEQYFEWHRYPISGLHGASENLEISHFVNVTAFKNLQSQMIQNEKMSAIGHLAGNIAHELNNPLTGIRSLCQILINEGGGSDQYISDLTEVEKGAARSQRIITNLLNFSSSSSDSVSQKVSLNSLVNKTLPLLKSITSEHEREIVLTEDSTEVFVEPHLTQQVIFNLVNNACQAMKGKGRLQVITEVSGSWVDLSVSDSGGGVPDAIGEMIFDPFFTTKSKVGGTGLGLSMSRTVVEKFGGKIYFKANDFGGTTFHVKLPLADGIEL